MQSPVGGAIQRCLDRDASSIDELSDLWPDELLGSGTELEMVGHYGDGMH